MNNPSTVVRLTRGQSLSWDDCRLLVESVTDYAIFMLDVQGQVATWNPGAERIKGYSASEILGQPFTRFYTPEDVAKGKPAYNLAAAQDHGRVEDEGWRLRKDGTRFWANVIITALRDPEGRLRGFAKVTRDLTEQRAAREDLRRSEERFHQLVDAVTDYSIFMLDAAGLVTTWNSGAQRIKGYATEEILGKHFSIFYTPQDQAAGKPNRVLEAVRTTGRFEEEGCRVRKDGAQFWAHVIITPLRSEGGDVIGYAKVTRDLTERRRAEHDLQHSEHRFRLLVDSVVDYAIYMLDREGRVTTWNVGAERMKGYSVEEIIGENFAKFFSEADVASGKPARELALAEAQGRFEDEGWRVRKDGTQFWANVVLTATRNAQGELIGFTKVTRDLTSRSQALETERRLVHEQAARAAAEVVAKKAEEANRIKDEFLATVSHELRTPLNVIVGWAAMLRQRQLEPSLAKAIEVIDRNAQAQARIVEDILDVSRIITGKLQLEPRPIDLVGTTRDAIEVIRHSVAAKRIQLTFEPQSEVFILVGDPDRLQQAIWNLLSNAVKFTDTGGCIRVDLRQDRSNLVLTITDTGRGIEPEFLPFVFDRFRQADASTTRRHGGLGLGLAIVRHIVELHGGFVAADSPGQGRGATFSITLPVRAVIVARSQERAAASLRPSPTPETEALRDLSILVVDDDPDACELASAVLTGAGARVHTARSAAEGLALVKRVRPQVLVSDIGMAEEDGYSLARRVRALLPEEGGGIPSLALTAFTRREDRAKALAAGFTTHIGKPVHPDDLLGAVLELAALAKR